MRIVLKPAGVAVLLAAMGSLSAIAFVGWSRSKAAVAAPPQARIKPTRPAGAAGTSALAGPANLVRNPSMSDGGGRDGKPAGWEEVWSERGVMVASRDTQTFYSAPAALCLRGTNPNVEVKGQLAQTIDARPGQKLRLRAYLKTSGRPQVHVALQPRDGSEQPLGFQSAGFRRGDSDWAPVEATLTAPERTRTISVVLYVDGKGSAWLDDVELTEEK